MAVTRTDGLLAVSRRMALPAESVWSVLVDTRTWPRWGPSVKAVEHDGDDLLRAGSRGRVRIPGGLWLPFEVTALDPGRAWSWRVAGVRATGHHVEPDGPAGCTVIFTVPWWAGPYVAVVRRGLRELEKLAHERLAARERDPEDETGGSPSRTKAAT